MKNGKTKTMARCALFIALMAVGSFIRIPTPLGAIALQAQVALLAGAVLGAGWGFTAIALYIVLGLVGAPVFAGGGGFAYVLQPTFGFLLGFALSALFVGGVLRLGVKTNKPSAKRIALALFVGLLVLYVVGWLYGVAILTLHINTSITLKAYGVYLLVLFPKDILLTLASVPLIKRIL